MSDNHGTDPVVDRSSQSEQKNYIILLIVAIVLTGLFIHLWNELTGPTGDFRSRQFALFLVSWLGAILASAFTCKMIHLGGYCLSSFGRCILSVIFFWPLFGLAIPTAEEWTIQYRKEAWDGPSDLGWNYIYTGMSGMGYGRGFMHGWRGVLPQVLNWCKWGILSALIWLPALALTASLLRDLRPFVRRFRA